MEMSFLGRSLAITGVIDADQVENPQWQVAEPVQAVLKAFEKSSADLRIVLAYMDEGACARWRKPCLKWTISLAGPRGRPSVQSRSAIRQ